MSKSTRDGSTSLQSVGASLSEDQDEDSNCAFLTSSHVFSGNGNSSKITRAVKQAATEVISAPLSRFKRRRRRKKLERLNGLRQLSSETITPNLEQDMKVFYDARDYPHTCNNAAMLSPIGTNGCMKRVGKDITPVDSVDGVNFKDCLTLIPRSYIVNEVFQNKERYVEYYDSLSSILRRHKGVMPRGSFRTPILFYS